MQQIWMYYKEKLTKKPCWPQYIRDQYVLKGPRYNLEMNLNPFVYLHVYTLPSSSSEMLRSYNKHR